MKEKSHAGHPSTEQPHRVQGGWGAATSAPGGKPESKPHGTTSDQISEMESEGQGQKPGAPDGAAPDGAVPDQDEHEGATEDQIGDRGGPAVGYDQGAKQKNPGPRR